MSLSLNKLVIYLGLLIFGGGVGVWGSRQIDRADRVTKEPVYSTAIPALSRSIGGGKSTQNINFIAQAVRKVGPAVVRIDASREVSSLLPENFKNPLFKRFFGSETPSSDTEKIERGTGSGFIISADGRLITNAHVVDGSDFVRVTLKDGRTYDGKVLGIDSVTDVAVLKIEAIDLPTVTFGKADNLTPGEWAIAIGNPLGLDNTVTVGIISAIDRSSSQVGVPDKRLKFIQTDAAINPGNSGGPLLNASGEVIGINTAIRADAEGLGFAIPIETAQRIADQLFAKGKADHPYLGVHMITLSEKTKEEIELQENLEFPITEKSGVLVVRVVPQSPAAKAGLMPGDIIHKIGKSVVETSAQVQEKVEISEIGEAVEIEVKRQGKTKVIEVRPGIFPEASIK
jgi:S1-C subfamily serine protease